MDVVNLFIFLLGVLVLHTARVTSDSGVRASLDQRVTSNKSDNKDDVVAGYVYSRYLVCFVYSIVLCCTVSVKLV